MCKSVHIRGFHVNVGRCTGPRMLFHRHGTDWIGLSFLFHKCYYCNYLIAIWLHASDDHYFMCNFRLSFWLAVNRCHIFNQLQSSLSPLRNAILIIPYLMFNFNFNIYPQFHIKSESKTTFFPLNTCLLKERSISLIMSHIDMPWDEVKTSQFAPMPTQNAEKKYSKCNKFTRGLSKLTIDRLQTTSATSYSFQNWFGGCCEKNDFFKKQCLLQSRMDLDVSIETCDFNVSSKNYCTW